MKCNRDCFNCPYEDCIEDELTAADYRELAEIDREIINPKDRRTNPPLYTIGSLFDGAGGFPFAAELCGGKALWASEIEKFPVAVTTKRFPEMKHLGDVTKIDGHKIDPVDVITFGSPCQDLSVAGKQKGLAGERSGLFAEAIRIIEEMREKTNGIYPAFAVWENVPGAFSSNKGEDFRSVLEKFCQVKDCNAIIPRPAKGKWSDAGEIVGDGYSVAWRVLDAQFWGVPQRRRRIFLVADFRGQRAGKILFKREGLSRSFAESRATWQGSSADLERSPGSAGRIFCLQGNGIDRADTAGCNGRGWREDVSYTLNTIDRPAVCYDARGHGNGSCAPTVTGDHQNRVTDYTGIVCMATQQGNAEICKNLCPTITAAAGMSGNNQPVLCAAIGNGQADQTKLHRIPGALNCMHDQQAIICIDRAAFNQGENAKYDPQISEDGISPTVIARGPNGCCYGMAYRASASAAGVSFCEEKSQTLKAGRQDGSVLYRALWCYIVRRFMPIECARLQGMPDWWCADVPHSDSAEYKMWGNGMALPCVLYVMEGVAEEMQRKGVKE